MTNLDLSNVEDVWNILGHDKPSLINRLTHLFNKTDTSYTVRSKKTLYRAKLGAYFCGTYAYELKPSKIYFAHTNLTQQKYSQPL